jgi:hypothetical protein
MILHTPQLIVLGLVLFGMGYSVSKYGQRKTDCYDWSDVLIGPAITLGLLYWGGFFG